MKLVIISDTHMHTMDPPDGDLLIHCGDLTYTGTDRELTAVAENLARVARRYTHGTVYVAGNHDWLFADDRRRAELILGSASYLEDRGLEIEGVKFWGSPWTPLFMDWAFMAEDDQLERYWRAIPNEVDVLITHGPPYGIRDLTDRRERAGSQTLRRQLLRVQPVVHCFGHIHEAYGEESVDGTHFINASACNASYESVNPAFEIELVLDHVSGRRGA